MIKAYILVHLLDGSSIKYVNKQVQDGNGKDGEYYSYKNEAGSKLEDQIGSGKVLGDFNSLVSQIADTGVITWPEGGTFIDRKNSDQPHSCKSRIRTVVPKKMISSVVIVEQELNEFKQLEISRA